MVQVGDLVKIVHLVTENSLPKGLLGNVYMVTEIGLTENRIRINEPGQRTWSVLPEEYVLADSEAQAVRQAELEKEKQKTQKKFKKIEEVLQRVYPDRYYIDGTTVLIHYPFIQTVNSRGFTHDHRDIFLELTFREDKLTNVHGLRSTYTFLEYKKSYRHPHIFPGNNTSEGDCCFGRGPCYILRHELGVKYNPDTFEAFLLSLIDWLQYESLEGGPYSRTANLTWNSGKPRNVKAETLQKYYQKFIKEVKEFPITFNTSSDKSSYVIPDSTKFEQLILGITDSQHLCVKSQGEYFRKGTIENRSEEIKKINEQAIKDQQFIQFRDQKFYLTVLDEPEVETHQILYPNPNITKYVKEQIQKELNEREYTKGSSSTTAVSETCQVS